MTDTCANCGEGITTGGIIKSPNVRHEQSAIDFVNLSNGTAFSALCQKCGQGPLRDAEREIAKCRRYVENRVGDFPMMTVQYLPADIRYRLKGMLTANVTVGTGLFSEFSQGFSDFFGAVNTQSGMAYKANSGETAARGILVNRALAIGANCIIGVDIDYGVTANNSATINMQGTAIVVEDLALLLHETEHARAAEITRIFSRLVQLNQARSAAFPANPN